MAEAADYLHISYRELHRRLDRGELPSIRYSPRLIRIAQTDLDSYITSKRKEGK